MSIRQSCLHRLVNLMFVLLTVKHLIDMEVVGSIIRGNWIKRQTTSYFVSSSKSTWKDAKESCSSLNAHLLDISNDADVHFLKDNVTFNGQKFWIGLRKNDSTLNTQVYQNEDDVLITDGGCLTARLNKSSLWEFKTTPCNWLRKSFCLKLTDMSGNCDEGWTRYEDSHCILPVYHQISWFAAYVHCKRLNGHLLKKEDLQKLLNAYFKINIYFWIGRRNRFKVEPKANWTWYKSNVVFSDWLKWEIRVQTIGCGGCGYWSRKRIFLNADCTKYRSAICVFELLDHKYFSNATERRSSWISAKNTCDTQSSLPQFTDRDVEQVFRNFSKDFHNFSIWLGLRKNILSKNDCISIEVENDTKLTDFTLERCYSVNCLNITKRKMQTPCDELHHPLCVQRKSQLKDICTEPWQDCKNVCCLVLNNVQASWIAAHTFCLQQGGQLADAYELRTDGINFTMKPSPKRCWLPKRHVFTPRDPLEGWHWINGSPLMVTSSWGVGELRYNGKLGRCAVIVDDRKWEDEPCSHTRTYICKSKKADLDDKDEIYKEIEKFDTYIKNYLRNDNVSQKQEGDKNTEEILPLFTNLVVGLVNKSSFNASFSIKTDGFELDVFTTSVKDLVDGKINTSHPTPMVSIRKLCENRQSCTVKGIIMEVESIRLNITSTGQASRSKVADVISLNYLVEGREVNELRGNETISLKFDRKEQSMQPQVHCIFLDGNQWSERGIENGVHNDRTAECIANHLTSFSMVVLDAELDEETMQSFSYISYIGSGLSLTALLFTLLVHIFLYNDLQVLSSSRQLVHLNLQIALGGTQIVFLAGGKQSKDEIFCKVVAILLHYFSLASFCWMLIEATMLYLKLISVFGGEYVQIKKFCAFGWGFPLAFVSISAAVKIDGYGTKEWCWLSYDSGYFWVFFAPVIIILSLNLVTVIAVVRVLCRVTSRCEDNEKQHIYAALRGIVILFPTLGLSWIFSVIAVNHDAMVWKYLFAIFNSIQGFLIFLIYGVCNGEIRTALKRRLGRDINPFSSTT
ncbi:adhesion G- coupled receptor D1-like [Paramuricea clavata]|uniref:Adhesion G- coupled receptor D1-like n=1 Tax=Paramuricea clavata TaxID=317549 RepID=A0A6S7GN52_PARCT|nr:adhesion G- coupled receptor D1-like [Paramuricea clavata]